MQRAVAGLSVRARPLLVDALDGARRRRRRSGRSSRATPSRVSIAAASIVAKVARDAMMRECDQRYPGYGLAHNMGYASDDHREALRRLGPSEIHRRSFHGTQRWLF